MVGPSFFFKKSKPLTSTASHRSRSSALSPCLRCREAAVHEGDPSDRSSALKTFSKHIVLLREWRILLDEVVMTPGGPPGSPTAGVGLNTLPPSEIQRYGALGKSIPVVFRSPAGGRGGPSVA